MFDLNAFRCMNQRAVFSIPMQQGTPPASLLATANEQPSLNVFLDILDSLIYSNASEHQACVRPTCMQTITHKQCKSLKKVKTDEGNKSVLVTYAAERHVPVTSLKFSVFVVLGELHKHVFESD